MKLNNLIKFFLAAAVGSVATLQAQEAKPAAPAQAAAPTATYTEAQVIETLGWFMGKQAGFSEFGLTKDQLDQLMKGFRSALEGKDAPFDPDKIGPEIGKFIDAKQQAYFGKLKEQGRAEGEKFFAELKNNKAVTFLPSGLGYEIVKPGSGDYPKPTDRVRVIYTGTFVNGTKFDSNVGGEPIEFALNGVIPGWSEGIQKINKGGTIKLYVPAKLGYGENGNRDIPPNATLLFEVQLVDIVPPPPPAPPAAPAAPAPAAEKK